MDKKAGEQLRRAGKLDFDRAVHLVPAHSIVGASTEQAVAHASAWLGSMRHDFATHGKKISNTAGELFEQLSGVAGSFFTAVSLRSPSDCVEAFSQV